MADKLGELALLIAKEAGEKLVRIPGIDAVCITLVGDGSAIPLGLAMCNHEKSGRATTVRAIARLSDHIEVLTRALLAEEELHVGTVDGQNGQGVGEQGQAQSLAVGDREPRRDESRVVAEAQEGRQDAGKSDPADPR